MCGRYAQKYTKTEDMQIRCMWRLGVPNTTIAQLLGRIGENAIKRRAQVLKVNRPNWFMAWHNSKQRKASMGER